MTKRTSVFTAVLVAIVSLAVGMVLASRLDLTPSSEAQGTYMPAANSDPISGAIDATTFRRIAQAVTPAVVSIQTESRARRGGTNDFLGQNPFFGNPRGQQAPERRQSGSGTGFIIDKAAGFILTNNHVVEGAETIKVGFFGDHRLADTYDAKVIGRDPLTDSALIQLTSRPDRELAQVNFGDSEQMAAGDWVMAIGNPFNLRHSVSVGVVSAVGRDEFQTVDQRSQVMIQTDAAINRGNSGGPLLNVRGEVIGINTAIYTNESSANIGIGFAVPINYVRNLLPQLRTGRIVRGQLGVSVLNQPFSAQEARDLGLPNGGGAMISTVNPDSAAAKAGMRPNDIVVEFNGQPVRSSDELIAMVVQAKPGVSVPVKIVRNRQQQTLNITVDELDLLAQEETEAETARGTEAGGIGVTIEPVTPRIARQLELPDGQTGALVTEVTPGSEAERGGLAAGDVIISVSGRDVRSVDDTSRAIAAVPQGSVVLLTIHRQGREVGLRIRKR
jgi:serine protease Do